MYAAKEVCRGNFDNYQIKRRSAPQSVTKQRIILLFKQSAALFFFLSLFATLKKACDDLLDQTYRRQSRSTNAQTTALFCFSIRFVSYSSVYISTKFPYSHVSRDFNLRYCQLKYSVNAIHSLYYCITLYCVYIIKWLCNMHFHCTRIVSIVKCVRELTFPRAQRAKFYEVEFCIAISMCD